MGHKNIQSTEFYVRHDLSIKEWKQVIKSANRERVNNFKIKLQENRLRKKRNKVDVLENTNK